MFFLWIGSWNQILVKPLSYIVAHHMFYKNTKRLFLWNFCLIELWIARIAKCFISLCGKMISRLIHFITSAIWCTCQSRNKFLDFFKLYLFKWYLCLRCNWCILLHTICFIKLQKHKKRFIFVFVKFVV